MITNQDFEDLKLLKILQGTKDLEKYKELRERFGQSFEQFFRIVEENYHLAKKMMDWIHELRDIMKEEEKIKREILQKIENEKSAE